MAQYVDGLARRKEVQWNDSFLESKRHQISSLLTHRSLLQTENYVQYVSLDK